MPTLEQIQRLVNACEALRLEYAPAQGRARPKDLLYLGTGCPDDRSVWERDPSVYKHNLDASLECLNEYQTALRACSWALQTEPILVHTNEIIL